MTDRPILFSSPMIKALRAGRKTQTRRILKPQPLAHGYYDGSIFLDLVKKALGWARFSAAAKGRAAVVEDLITFRISVGDRLWVREAFSYDTLDVDRDGLMPAWYWADGNPEDGDWTRPKPSIHMPRVYSRLTLTVTDVRVQRLQEISEADCFAEGIGDTDFYDNAEDKVSAGAPWPVERLAYADLWNSINGEVSWDANPWVAGYSFTVEQRNIDA